MIVCLCVKAPRGGPSCFSFVSSDPDATWNVDEMHSRLDVACVTLPPVSDVGASQPVRVHVLFKAPSQDTRSAAGKHN